jgi:hypothetical protein
MKASPLSASFDARLYRVGLSLYPPAFRRDFATDMLRDFNDARTETQSSGRHRDLWILRARMGTDLLRTISLQWLRTGLPLIAVLSLTCALVAAATLVSLWPRMDLDLPSGTADADAIALALLAVTVVIFIASTIMLTLWILPTLLRRRSSRNPRRVTTKGRLFG